MQRITIPCCLFLLIFTVGFPAWPAAPIGSRTGDSRNLVIVDIPAPDQIIAKPAPPVHNWFAGTFTHLPTDVPVTITLDMAGTETELNPGAVRKWQGLRPVMTYADPEHYETYEWFTRDAAGQWVSGDPFKHGEQRLAGNGKTPAQTAIPAELAAAFLSDDGQYWSAWREIDQCEARPETQTFRITQQFAAPSVTVAMRIPCPAAYVQAYTDRLLAVKHPGVFVDDLGFTPDGRPLRIIRVEDPALTPGDDRRTILVTGGEHATEHAASWAALGMLGALLEDTPRAQALRGGRVWLFAPVQDLDGRARSLFNRMTDQWAKVDDPAPPPEVFSYIRYLSKYIYAGHVLDLTISLHNLEANEGPHLLSPLADMRNVPAALAGNRAVMQAARGAGFQIADPDKPWSTGFMTFRLYAWAALSYGALDLAFEVNDRYPTQRLAHRQLLELGAAMTQGVADWCAGDEGRQWHDKARAFMAKKTAQRAYYYDIEAQRRQYREKHDLLIRGY